MLSEFTAEIKLVVNADRFRGLFYKHRFAFKQFLRFLHPDIAEIAEQRNPCRMPEYRVEVSGRIMDGSGKGVEGDFFPVTVFQILL